MAPVQSEESDQAKNSSRQKTQALALAASARGRLTPSAYPNSQGSPAFKFFSVMKFSDIFQPFALLEGISFISNSRSVSDRPWPFESRSSDMRTCPPTS